MQRTEIIRFNGRNYRRYPDSERRDLRVYYAGRLNNRSVYLHRAVWEHHHGAIPAGYHVHHLDENPLNNAIENLHAMPGREHLSMHMLEPERQAQSRLNIKHAIAAAPQWHKSEAGRKWHAQHAKDIWTDKPMLPCGPCKVCGAMFETRTGTATVCSNACFANQRYHSRVDDVARTCKWCSKEFMANKYGKQAFCSRSCNTRNTNAKRKCGPTV